MPDSLLDTDSNGENRTGLLSKRSWRWLVLIPLLIVAFTSWVWWQSRGIESRMLAYIQPHLATDVHVDGLSVSLWSAWPDVEVNLHGVRVEDVLRPGHDFLVMKEVGIRVACLPLLYDRLEIRSFRLAGGRLDLDRKEDGSQNWVFWKAVIQKKQGPSLSSWQVDALELEDVTTTGKWTTESGVLSWSGALDAAKVSLASESGGAFVTRGQVVGQRISVLSGGTQWMSELGLKLEFGGRIDSSGVVLGLQKATVFGGDPREGGGMDVTGTLVVSEGLFGLALDAAEAQIKSVDRCLPPGVREGLGSGLGALNGQSSVALRLGKEALSKVNLLGWAGPKTVDWTGSWAVQVLPSTVTWTHDGERLEVGAGGMELMSTLHGWTAVGRNLSGRAAEGEWACEAAVYSNGKALDIQVEGQGVFRPKPLSRWFTGQMKLPKPWRVGEGGVLKWDGALHMRSVGQDPWSVAFEPGAQLRGEGLQLLNGDSALTIQDALAESTKDGWHVMVSDITMPGAQGDAVLNWSSVDGDLNVDFAELDVDRLLRFTSASTVSEGPGFPDFVRNWSVSIAGTNAQVGALMADKWAVNGTYLNGRFVAESIFAEAFDGDLKAKGSWEDGAARFNGRLVNADLSEFLLGTSGLGQTTLRSDHVRGRVWAEGWVTYDSKRSGSVPWDVDVEVRVEEGELVGFELLQAIPRTLAEERKYQFISDADDLKRRLNWVRFQPISTQVALNKGVVSLAPTEVYSDAMDLGVEGWYRLGGEMDFTLDFALRDLKSDQGDWGPMEEDGLGHRFFLAMRGTMENPSFGYDRAAHQEHRRGQRQSAWSRLRGALGAEDAAPMVPDTLVNEGPLVEPPTPSERPKIKGSLPDDDDDDF